MLKYRRPAEPTCVAQGNWYWCHRNRGPRHISDTIAFIRVPSLCDMIFSTNSLVRSLLISYASLRLCGNLVSDMTVSSTEAEINLKTLPVSPYLESAPHRLYEADPTRRPRSSQ